MILFKISLSSLKGPLMLSFSIQYFPSFFFLSAIQDDPLFFYLFVLIHLFLPFFFFLSFCPFFLSMFCIVSIPGMAKNNNTTVRGAIQLQMWRLIYKGSKILIFRNESVFDILSALLMLLRYLMFYIILMREANQEWFEEYDQRKSISMFTPILHDGHRIQYWFTWVNSNHRCTPVCQSVCWQMLEYMETAHYVFM